MLIVFCNIKKKRTHSPFRNVSISVHKKCLFHKIYLLNSQNKDPNKRIENEMDFFGTMAGTFGQIDYESPFSELMKAMMATQIINDEIE